MIIAFLNSGIWTPAQITTSLWLDASDATTITESGGAVSQWDDKSGNGNDAVQGVGASQPSTGVNSLNSLNVIKFDSDYMSFDSNITDVKSAIFVMNNLNGNSTNNIFSYPFSDGISVVSSNFTGVATNISIAYDISLDGSVSNSGNASVNGEPLVSGDNIDLGNGITQNKLGNIWYTDYDNSIIAKLVGAVDSPIGFKLLGDIAEVILLSTVPSTSERQKIEGYLAHKWGLVSNLPLAHPYKNSAP